VTTTDGARPSRVHVIGGEATGKTTIARRIGATLGAPVHNLDGVAWVIGESEFSVLDPLYQPSASVEDRPLEDRLRIVAEIATGPAWVTEGKYLEWTTPLFERADVIVFLDHVGVVTAIRRILGRAARSAVREAGRDERPGLLTRLTGYVVHGWELAVQVLKRVAFELRPARAGMRPGGEPTRAGMIAALVPYRAKVVRIRRAEDIERFIADLQG
jgi:hypothetical protein